jgi:hypothetical protein
MFHALEGLQDALDGDLDTAEAARLEAHLTIASQSERDEIVSLADAISHYLRKEEGMLKAAEHSLWIRIALWADRNGRKLGRRSHLNSILVVLELWTNIVIGYVAILVLGVPSLDSQIVQLRNPLVAVQIVIGALMIMGAAAWHSGHEESGLKVAVIGSLLSLIVLQSLYFFLTQFAVITSTLVQLTFQFYLLVYRRWYLSAD